MIAKLSSKLWRLNNLYTIEDKDGVKMIMRLNPSQTKVITQFRHNKKIILKARQQGISTLYLAYNLDSCIFGTGFSAGIQSYGQDESNKLQRRAELMWDEFPQEVKDLLGIRMASNNSKGMSFSNRSILKIGNFRGDTLQSLHVSELGKIAKKFPDKARELKTGAFQAVSVKNKITIESTAEGKTGLFYDMWETATTRAASTEALTPLDFQPIFLSWMNDPDCQLHYSYPRSKEVNSYVSKLEAAENVRLEDTQINWLAAKISELGDDFNQEYPATPEMAFSAQVEGMYFKAQYLRLQDSDRIHKIDYDPMYPVFVSFDLGINDETVMLFAQLIAGQPVLIDEYHNKDESIVHYATILKNLPYSGNYEQIIMPHDVMVRDYSTGRTRLETFQREGFSRVTVLEKLSFLDSIEAARQFIDIAEFDTNMINTLLCLQNYRKKYDKVLGVFLGTDVHDIHSNYAASLRYMAQGLGHYSVERDKPVSDEEQYRRFKSNNSTNFSI